jgi:DNA-binding XRE family transcriptional regulator
LDGELSDKKRATLPAIAAYGAASGKRKEPIVRDFLLFAAQIRAARGLLGWSQQYLADGMNVNRSTIVMLEAGDREPHLATISVLMIELSAAGIVFTSRGVEFSSWPPEPYVPTGMKQKTSGGRGL